MLSTSSAMSAFASGSDCDLMVSKVIGALRPLSSPVKTIIRSAVEPARLTLCVRAAWSREVDQNYRGQQVSLDKSKQTVVSRVWPTTQTNFASLPSSDDIQK